MGEEKSNSSPMDDRFASMISWRKTASVRPKSVGGCLGETAPKRTPERERATCPPVEQECGVACHIFAGQLVVASNVDRRRSEHWDPS